MKCKKCGKEMYKTTEGLYIHFCMPDIRAEGSPRAYPDFMDKMMDHMRLAIYTGTPSSRDHWVIKYLTNDSSDGLNWCGKPIKGVSMSGHSISHVWEDEAEKEVEEYRDPFDLLKEKLA